MAKSTKYTYSQEALDEANRIKDRAQEGATALAETVFDTADRVALAADELALAIKMRRDGELSEQNFDRALYRHLYKLNEMVGEVADDYQIDV